MAAHVVNYSMNIDDVFNPAYIAVATGVATSQSNTDPRSGTWTSRTMPVSSAWSSVDYGNGLLVAVSETSGIIAASSIDGTTWIQRDLPTSTTWKAVKSGYAGTTFRWVAVSSAGNYAATSADGSTWTARTITGTAYAWSSMAYGNGVWVALANTASANTLRTAVTSDGITWSNNNTTSITCTGNWTSITFGGGYFVAVCSGGTVAAYSTDGINWSSSVLPASTTWVSVAYGDGVYIAVTSTNSANAARSTNGTSWSEITFPAASTWRAVIFGKNIIGEGIFAGIGATTVGNYSLDGGNTWNAKTQVTMTYTAACYAPFTWRSNDTLTVNNASILTCNTDQKKFWATMALANGKLLVTNASSSTGITFAMGRASGAGAGTITPSSGLGEIEFIGDWIQIGTGSGSDGQTVTAPFTDYIPALWVQTGSAVDDPYEQWINVTGAYGDNNNLMHEGLEAVGNGVRGKFFVQGANNGPYGPINPIGTAITPRAQYYLSVDSTSGIIEGAQIYGSALTANSVVNKVVDGNTLELNNPTANLGTIDWKCVAYGNVSGTTPTFVALSKVYSNVAATSTDGGATWTKRTLPFKGDWMAVCYGATSGRFVAVCNNVNLCATSTDGITWETQYMPSTLGWKAVASNGTSFVAVGSDTAGAATTAAASSVDGLTWVAAVMATSAIWQAVAYGGTRYVAVSSTFNSNWDLDGAGTWTAGGTMTAGNFVGIAYTGSRFVAVSGNSTVSRYSTDATSWSTGGVLTNAVSTAIAWTGSTLVVTSKYTTAGSSVMTSTDGAAWTARASQTRNAWNGVAAGNSITVMVAGSDWTTSYIGSGISTSDATGVTWVDRSSNSQVIYPAYTVFNPYKNQLTNQITFGNNINGNRVPTGARIRCPNVMITSFTPANLHTSSNALGTSIVSTNGGPVTMTTVLNDECYHNFGQAQKVTLTDVGFSIPFIVTECYDVNMTRVAFALQPMRRYFTTNWYSRDTRYGQNAAWNYINNAEITDLKIVIGSTASQYGNATVNAPITLSYTDNATFLRLAVFCLNPIKTLHTGIISSAMMTNCDFTDCTFVGVLPFSITTSSNNTFTNTTVAQRMYTGKMGMGTTLTRVGIDPSTNASLIDGTKYYFKVRSYRDSTDLSKYVEGPVVSATPFLASKLFSPRFSAVNTASTTVTFNWDRRDPASSSLAFEIFRGASAGFTRNLAARVFNTATTTTITATDTTVSNGNTYYYVLRKYDGHFAGITNSSGTSGATALGTSQNFLTGLGTVANCYGTAGTRKVYLEAGAATNFLATMIVVGMPISGGGLAANTTVVSIDTELEITVNQDISTDFTVSTLSLGAVAGMYVNGTGIVGGTRVQSVDSATAITVDTPFSGTVSGTLTFLYGTESAEVEVYVAGAKETASNLLLQSYDYTNGTWVKTNITATAASFYPPEQVGFNTGTMAAVGVRLYSTGPNANMVQTLAGLTSSTAYCFSGYFRTDPSLLNNSNQVSVTVTINTSTPTTSTFNVTGKWQRIEIPFTSTNTTHTFTVTINENGKYIFPSCLQLNLGGSATVPVTTTTAAVTLNPVVQEITAAYAWCRSYGGDVANQGIEIVLATAPSGTHYTDVFMGTTSNFVPSKNNLVDTTIPSGGTLFNLATSSGNLVETVNQINKGYLCTFAALAGSSDNIFKNITFDFGWAVSYLLNLSALSNNLLFHNMVISKLRNYLVSPFTTVNNTSTITLQNILFDTYDIPYVISSLDTVLKGVSGGNAAPAGTATTWNMGSTTDGMGVANITVYDSIFNEMYHSPTTGALNIFFNDSSKTTKPFTILSGTPKFSNTGKLYLQTAGDSIEYEWPHKIMGVTGFRNLRPKLNGLDLGTSVNTLNGLKLEFAINNGSSYGSWYPLTGPYLSAATVNYTDGFKIKIKITVRTGMKYTSQSNAFIINEQIRGATSLATAYVREDYDLGTTGEVILDTIVGSFIAGEAIVRHSDAQARATNLATNTNFALFPSFTSYIDGLEIYTTVNTATKYSLAVKVPCTITAVNASTGALIQGARVYALAAAGGLETEGTIIYNGLTDVNGEINFEYDYISNQPIGGKVRKSSESPYYKTNQISATIGSSGLDLAIFLIPDE